MEVLQTDTLEPNTKGKQLFFAVCMAAAVMLIVLAISGFAQVLFYLLGFIGFVYGASKYFLQTRKQVLKKANGRLVLAEDYIVIRQHQVALADIQHITIDVTGWRCYSRTHAKEYPMEFHSGDKNYLTIGSRNGKLHCEFLLGDEQQWKLLREHLLYWYRSGIRVTEKVMGGTSHGLQHCNYAQIQEFKKLISNQRTTA